MSKVLLLKEISLSFALFGVIVFVINTTFEFKAVNVEVTNQVNMSVSQGVKCCLYTTPQYFLPIRFINCDLKGLKRVTLICLLCPMLVIIQF